MIRIAGVDIRDISYDHAMKRVLRESRERMESMGLEFTDTDRDEVLEMFHEVIRERSVVLKTYAVYFGALVVFNAIGLIRWMLL